METSVKSLGPAWQKIANANQGFFLTVRHNALLSIAIRPDDSALPETDVEHVLDAVNLKSEGWGRSTNHPPGVIYMKSLDPEDTHNVCVTTWVME